MEPYESNNRTWRNAAVIVLLIVGLIGVAFFSLIAHERYTRQERLNKCIEGEERRGFPYSAPISLGRYTVVFESGRLSVMEGDRTVSYAYTEFDHPLFNCERGMCAVFSYPSDQLYLISAEDGVCRLLRVSTPVSAVRCAAEGVFATLHDLDSTVCVYTYAGDQVMRIRSDCPVIDMAISERGDRLMMITASTKDSGTYRSECFSVSNGSRKYAVSFAASTPPSCQTEGLRLFIWSADERFMLTRTGKLYLLS